MKSEKNLIRSEIIQCHTDPNKSFDSPQVYRPYTISLPQYLITSLQP